MLKAALIGLGGMGQGHLVEYLKMEKRGVPVELVAICDLDREKLNGKAITINLNFDDMKADFSKYRAYTDVDELFEKETELDYVDIVLPTYLHAEVAMKAFKKGLHVMCEKPMALRPEDCEKMIEASKAAGKKLMIGQCLRFSPEYKELKRYVDSGEFGKVLGGYFYRGGSTPKWSYQNWYLQKDKSGGAVLDQHVHDIDTINWLFGKPDYVSTSGRNCIEGSGVDIVSTNYFYPDGKVINAQDDWMLNGDYGFRMLYRVTFEKGNLDYAGGVLTVNPDNAPSFKPELKEDPDHLYNELSYFAMSIINDTPVSACPPESTADSIRIAAAEVRSAENQGKFEKIV